MSNLSDIDKLYLEKTFNMGTGHVFDFSDASLDKFFKQHQIDIHAQNIKHTEHQKLTKCEAFGSKNQMK